MKIENVLREIKYFPKKCIQNWAFFCYFWPTCVVSIYLHYPWTSKALDVQALPYIFAYDVPFLKNFLDLPTLKLWKFISYISFWFSTDGMLFNNRQFMEAQYGTILQADMHSFKAFTVVLEQMFLWQPLLGEFTLQRELGELCSILDCSSIIWDAIAFVVVSSTFYWACRVFFLLT